MAKQNSMEERSNKENKKKKSVWNIFGGGEEERDSTRMGPQSDELKTIKTLITAYFKIVKRNLIDYVPKTIITLLVNESCDICEKELVSRLYSDDKINNLLMRNPSMQNKQKEIEYNLEMLKKCQFILDNFDRASSF